MLSISQEACHLPGLDPHERQTREGRGAEGRGSGRGHLVCAGHRVCKCSQLRRAAGKTHAPSLSARASFRFEVQALGETRVELSRSSSLRLLIFISRPLCSYFVGDESYKGSVGIQGVTSRQGYPVLDLPSWPGSGEEMRSWGRVPQGSKEPLCRYLTCPVSFRIRIEDVNSDGL